MVSINDNKIKNRIFTPKTFVTFAKNGNELLTEDSSILESKRNYESNDFTLRIKERFAKISLFMTVKVLIYVVDAFVYQVTSNAETRNCY